MPVLRFLGQRPRQRNIFNQHHAVLTGKRLDPLRHFVVTFRDHDRGRHFLFVIFQHDSHMGGFGDNHVGLGYLLSLASPAAQSVRPASSTIRGNAAGRNIDRTRALTVMPSALALAWSDVHSSVVILIE